jgi:hypothetical protein
MGLKLHQKYNRADKITKAIISDINWDKIGNITRSQELVGNLNSAITDFREQITSTLIEILIEEHDNVICHVRDISSSPEIYDAARTMAIKYHKRSTKKTKKRRRSKLTNNTTNPIKPPPTPPRLEPPVLSNSPSIFNTQVPHSFNFNINTKKQTPPTNTAIKCPTTLNKLPDSPSSQARTSVRRDSSSSPSPRSINETRETDQLQPSQLSNTTNGAHGQSESTNGSFRSTGLFHNNKAKQQSLKRYSFKVKKATNRNIFK